MKSLERAVVLVATALTILVFLTGYNLPELLSSIDNRMQPLLRHGTGEDMAPDVISRDRVFAWIIGTLLASVVTASIVSLHSRITGGLSPLRDFLSVLWICSSMFTIIGGIYSFHVGDKFKELLLTIICCAILVGVCMYALAKRVNVLGHWPQDVGTNAFFTCLFIGSPLMFFSSKVALGIILLGITLGAVCGIVAGRDGD